MLRGEHSAILSTCIKLPLVIKNFVLSIFEWPLKTGFTVVILPGTPVGKAINLLNGINHSGDSRSKGLFLYKNIRVIIAIP